MIADMSAADAIPRQPLIASQKQPGGFDSEQPAGRQVVDIIIIPTGDAILEFSNAPGPVLRYRVSSHLLAETSPLFASVFSGGLPAPGHLDLSAPPCLTDRPEDHLPRGPPDPVVLADGSCVLRYRMPQSESSTQNGQYDETGSTYESKTGVASSERALTTLLRAAHLQHDRVPREITYERLAALAAVALRYRCTAPLELLVEHVWLPRWAHRAGDTGVVPEELVLVSYVFGARKLFARATRTAVLRLAPAAEEDDDRRGDGPLVQSCPSWPRRLREKIWALRCEKMARVLEVCTQAVEEFLRTSMPPAKKESGESQSKSCRNRDSKASVPFTTPAPSSHPKVLAREPMAASLNLFAARHVPPCSWAMSTLPKHRPSARIERKRSMANFTRRPRCPKGSRWCDASNMGHLMFVFRELQLLAPMAVSESLSDPPRGATTSPPSVQSLAEIVDNLCTASSPPSVHSPLAGRAASTMASAAPKGDICDPMPDLRAAVLDVYNSISGLTLFDIDGREDWALSRRTAESLPSRAHPRENGRQDYEVVGGDKHAKDCPGPGVLSSSRDKSSTSQPSQPLANNEARTRQAPGPQSVISSPATLLLLNCSTPGAPLVAEEWLHGRRANMDDKQKGGVRGAEKKLLRQDDKRLLDETVGSGQRTW